MKDLAGMPSAINDDASWRRMAYRLESFTVALNVIMKSPRTSPPQEPITRAAVMSSAETLRAQLRDFNRWFAQVDTSGFP